MADTGSFAGSAVLRTSDTSASCLGVALGSLYPNAAVTLVRSQGGRHVAAVESFDHPVDEVEVHAADQRGVLGCELVEGAVGEANLLLVNTGLVAQRFKCLRSPTQLRGHAGTGAHPSPGPGLAGLSGLGCAPSMRLGSGPDRHWKRRLVAQRVVHRRGHHLARELVVPLREG